MPDEWVELRVHGVHATAPESMLNIDRVRQVAGDQLGRFFRPADRGGTVLPSAGHQVLEGYSWGRLTSGSFVTGLWLLLAPFGLVNAAQFALPRPTPGTARAAHAVAGAMLRLVGLCLTALFVYTATVMTLDLWVWQGKNATSGVAYAVALLGPVALLVVFQQLVRSRPRAAGREQDRNRPPTPTRTQATATATNGAYVSELTRPGFFEGNPEAPALRRLHVAAGLAMVAIAGSTTAAVDRDGFWTWAPIILIIVVTGVTVFLGDPEGSAHVDLAGTALPDGPTRRKLLSDAVALLLYAVGLGAVVAAVIRVWRFPPLHAAPLTEPPAIGSIGTSVVVVAAAAAGVLAVANLVLALTVRRPGGCAATSDDRPFRPYGAGMACTLVTLLGVFLGVGYSGALTILVARVFDPSGKAIKPPDLLASIAYAWGWTAVAIVLFGGVLLRGWRAGRHTLTGRVREDFRNGWRQTIPTQWIGQVAFAMWTARLKNHLVCVLAVFGGVGVVLTVPVVWLLAPPLFGLPASPLPSPVPALLTITPGDTPPPLQVALTTVGTFTLSTIAGGLVTLARSALLGESARRGVNVIWDVISFWPRSAHPFVPAAYSQRAVADLEDRIRWHLGSQQSKALALCCHSQGSLLGFAALVRLAATEGSDGRELLDRIAFLTFGSQLQVMFSRGFPAYVNLAAITGLFDQLGGRWRNLYRDTDPLAGPVLSWHHTSTKRWMNKPTAAPPPQPPEPVRRTAREEFGPDWRLIDPPPPRAADLEPTPLLAVRGHSDFWLDPAWYEAIAEMVGGYGVAIDRSSVPTALP